MSTDQEKGRADATKPPRLGRGLSALMGVSPVQVDVPGSPQPARDQAPSADAGVATISNRPAPEINPKHELLDLVSLPLKALLPNRFQPRRDVSGSDLAALAASIKSAGVMQPVIVRPLPAGSGGGPSYEIVAGERRWRAARLAGLTHIPALVRELTDEQAAEWALVENVQREDLNAMDRAVALKSLCDKFQVTHADLGARIGLERSTIANLVRLTELEPEIAALISKNILSAGHGKALLAAPAGAARIALAKEAAERSYSVRKLESEAKHLAMPGAARAASAAQPTPREAVLRDIEKRISQALGTKVAIRTDSTGKRGQITLDFYDLDQFDGLLARLGVSSS
jgi:ParB family transcriptional regulator, chromosome partitioning protein